MVVISGPIIPRQWFTFRAALLLGSLLFASASAHLLAQDDGWYPPYGGIDSITPNPAPQNQTITVNGWVASDDPSGPAAVVVFIDSNQISDIGGPGACSWTWSFSYDTSGLSLGQHTVSAIGFDSQGAVSTIALNVPFTVTGAVPQAGLTPSATTIQYGQSISFTVTGSCSSGLSQIGLESCNSSGTTTANLGFANVSDTSDAATFSWTAHPGTYYFDSYAWNNDYTQLTRASLITITVVRAPPVVSWATNPAAITYGTALSSTQLNATANVPGTFAYTPSAGTILTAGSNPLSVMFTPSDTTDYTSASASVLLTVNPQPVTFTVSPVSFTYTGGAQGPAITPSVAGATYSTTGTASATAAGSYSVAVTATGSYTGTSGSTAWTIAKATPLFLNWSSRAIPNSTGYTVLPGDLNAGLSNPYNSLAPTPTGAIVYSVVSCSSGAVAAGTAITSGALLPPANYTIQASYPGDSNYNPATADVTWIISNPVTLNTASATNVFFGQTVTITSSSADNDSLLVSEAIDYLPPPGSTWVTDAATWSSATPVGSHTLTWTIPTSIFNIIGQWQVRGSGTNSLGFVSPYLSVLTINLAKATPAISSNWSNQTFPTAHTVTSADLATLTNPYSSNVALPTGAITYSIVSGGSGPFVAGTQFSPGTYTIRASYAGDTNYTPLTADIVWKIIHPPVVSLTSPTNSSTFTVPATVTLAASASSPDGTIAKVDFYDGANLVQTVTSAPYQYTWNYVAVGNHTLTAEATDNYGASTTSSPVSITVNSLRQSGGTATLGNTLPSAWSTLGAGDPSRANVAVGITTGQLSVDKSGAATYTIPLYACPGTAGMEPKLSLSYSSSAGAGVLGYGWSLNGTSVITRGAQSAAIDGNGSAVDANGNSTFVHGMNFALTDRYYLDGQRLIAINGADGADGTEYRTEMDSFSRVVSYGSDANGTGPAYFKVWTKSGQIVEFGHTGDSALTPQSPGGTTLSWAVDKISDTVGNYMTFSYSTNTSTSSPTVPDTGPGEQLLTEIDYTGTSNTKVNTQPYNSVKFVYTTRNDSSSGYVHGALISRTQIMTDIEAYNGSNLIRHYEMDYINRPNTNRSILADIKEIGADGNAYPPLTFNYDSCPSTTPAWDQSQSSTWAPPAPLAIEGQPSQGAGFIDLTGSGRPDFVQYHVDANGNTIAINSWVNDPVRGWVPSDGTNGTANWTLPMALADDQQTANGIPLPTRFVDLTGNGRPDITDGKTAYLNTGWGWVQSARFSLPDEDPHVAETYPSSTDGGPGWIYTRGVGQYVDLNGDGLPDYVVLGSSVYYPQVGYTDAGYGVAYDASVTVYFSEVWINQGPGSDNSPGAGWVYSPQYAPPDDGTGTGGAGISFMDVNGDGLPDVVENLDGPNVKMVALNTGKGWNILAPGSADFNRFVPPVPLNQVGPPPYGGPIGTEVVDLNGDGLPDIISWDQSNLVPQVTYLNTGNGWVQDPGPYLAPAPLWDSGLAQTLNQTGNIGRAFLNINGNGLADFVCYQIDGNGNPSAATWLNTGSGWSQQVSTDYNLPWQIASRNNQNQVTGADFVDLNGTGAMDEVWNFQDINGGNHRGAALNNRVNVDRLKTVTTGMGVSTTITYKPLTDPTVYTKGNTATYPEMDVINPTYVVSEVDNDDGVGGQYAMTYRYAGLRSSVIHGNEGFASMTVTDTRTGISTVTDYHQDYPFIGMALSSITQLGGQILTESNTTWVDQGSYANVHFPCASQVEQYAYELNGNFVSGTSTSTVYSTDGYGNALTVDVEAINADGTSAQYDKDTTNTYDNIVTSDNWFLGRLSRSQTTFCASGTPQIERISAFAYDSASGLLTQEIVEPDDTSTTNPQKLTTTYAYDSFGNKISATVCGLGFAPRTVATAYDSLGQFPVSTTNALGQQETYVYDARWGVMTSQTDPNGLTITWGYDGMGREIQENRPDGTTTNINYRWAGAGAPASPAGCAPTAYLIETDSSGAPPALAFYDSRGRAIYAFGLNGGGFDGNLQIVGSQTQYDSMGRAFWTSLPFYYGDTPAVGSEVTQYDPLNRPLTQIGADEEVSGGFVSTSFEYDGLVTTATNPAGQVAITTKNSQGQVLSVVTNADAAAATDRGETDYTYDAVGNVLATTVVNGSGTAATTSFAYDDVAGRKIKMTDPDMGAWTYAYDAAGELVSQTDAKGQTTTMTYDPLGRLVTRTEAEGTTTWTYDSAQYGIGKLASISAPNNYSESYTYDSLGRPSVTTRNINTGSSATLNVETFTIGQQYDAFGRPTVTTYNRIFSVTNVYNNYGFLKEVRQYNANDTTQNQLFWQADRYSVLGGIDGCTYGNGVTEDSVIATTTGRIQGFGIGLASGNSVASYGYWHDALGNLVVRNDDTTGRSESYTYDGLNRLTSTALTVNPGGLGTSSTVTVAYDSLGNILNKSDVGAYTYSQNGTVPHAVTAAGGNSYQYDADGNMVAASVNVGGVPTPRTLAWTSFNQVQNITQGSHYSTFTFDADHQRATQVTDHGTTVYVGNAFERVTNGSDVQYKFYIFTPAGRSVVRTIDGGTVTTRYLHQDALGSIVAVTDENGAVTERYAYDPWGKQTALDPQPSTLNAQPAATTRGFTDQEMLPDLGLIHMNGRIYDPVPGRFLSADPVVQSPSDSQSYNRYSYIMNNPLGGTDPTGFTSDPDQFSAQQLADSLQVFNSMGLGTPPIPGLSNGLISDKIDQAFEDGDLKGNLNEELAQFASGYSGSLLNAFNLTYAFLSPMVGVSGRGGNLIVSGSGGNSIVSGDGGNTPYLLSTYTVTGTSDSNSAADATLGGTASDLGNVNYANGADTGAFAHSNGPNNADDTVDLKGSRGGGYHGSTLGSNLVPQSGSGGWNKVIVIYNGNAQSDPNDVQHATGNQLTDIAFYTVNNGAYAINAQSTQQALAEIKDNNIQPGTANYLVILDHGAENFWGSARVGLGDQVLAPSDFVPLAGYLNQGGALVCFNCSAGSSTSYVQDIADATGHRVYAFPTTVNIHVDSPLPVPIPSGSGAWPHADPNPK
jgi:RHS repeat-associated protein